MKIRALLLLSCALVIGGVAVTYAAPVNLSTMFGAGATFGTAGSCAFTAVDNVTAVTSGTEIDLVANGTDNATISLACNGVPVTAAVPIRVNGGPFGSPVAFPQTVMATAPGVWIVSISGQFAGPPPQINITAH